MTISAQDFYKKFLEPMGVPTNCKRAVITVDVDEPVTVELTLNAIISDGEEKILTEEIKKYRIELCEPDDSTDK